jgi:hypothetical protein
LGCTSPSIRARPAERRGSRRRHRPTPRTDPRRLCKRAPIPSDGPHRVTNICSSLQPTACAPGSRSSMTSSATLRLTRMSVSKLGRCTRIAARSAASASVAPAACRPHPPTASARSGPRRMSGDEARWCDSRCFIRPERIESGSGRRNSKPAVRPCKPAARRSIPIARPRGPLRHAVHGRSDARAS